MQQSQNTGPFQTAPKHPMGKAYAFLLLTSLPPLLVGLLATILGTSSLLMIAAGISILLLVLLWPKANPRIHSTVMEESVLAHDSFLVSLASSSKGVCIVNAHDITEFVNQPLADLLGHPIHEMFGRHIADFVEDAGSLGPLPPATSLLETSSKSRSVKLHLAKGEVLQTNMRCQRLYDPYGQYVGAIQTFEVELAESVSKKTPLVESVGGTNFLADGIVHEINNPLSVIDGKARILKKMAENENVDTQSVSKTADDISRTVGRITRIIKGLRSFYAGASNDPFSKIVLKDLINETVDFATERFANGKVALNLPKIDGNLQLECRPTQISQLVLNLLNNAYDAVCSQEGAWVTLEIDALDEEILTISVTDSGHGIDPEVARKMMQPFYTTKAAGKGTGLGLSICSGIAVSHSGSLVYDASCSHTRFLVRLPWSQPKSQQKPNIAA